MRSRPPGLNEGWVKGCQAGGFFPVPAQWLRQQVRAGYEQAAFLCQNIPDFLVGLTFVNQLCDCLASRVRRATAVGIATGQGVEVAGAGVLLHRADAVGTREKPLDAFGL